MRGWRERLAHVFSGLRFRLIGVFLALGVVASALFSIGSDQVIERGWNALAQPLLRDYVARLAADLGSPPDVARARKLVAQLPITLRITGPSVQWSSSNREQDYGARWRDEATTDPNAGQHLGTRKQQDPERFWVTSTADGHRLAFGLDLAMWQRDRSGGLLLLASLLAAIALAGWWIGRMLSPIGQVSAGAKRFGAGQFDQPITVSKAAGRELRELGDTVNTMGQDIKAMLDAKRALLLAISHELRSPLTRARLNAELLDHAHSTPQASTRDALVADLAEMSQLITDLLDSERLQSGHAALNAEQVDLNALTQEVCASFGAIELQLPNSVALAQVDVARIRLLLRNLLSNAKRHAALATKPTQVRLTHDAQNHTWALQVRDFGPGVEQTHIKQLTQAFYRPDSARARPQGGVGLGLYLCDTIAKAHGGSLHIANANPGLAVTLSGLRGA